MFLLSHPWNQKQFKNCPNCKFKTTLVSKYFLFSITEMENFSMKHKIWDFESGGKSRKNGYSGLWPHFSVMILRIIDKPKNVFVFFHIKITSIIFDGIFSTNSLVSFLGILISKQITPAFLLSFQLRLKTPFHKDVMDKHCCF